MRSNVLKSAVAVLALSMMVAPAFAKPETKIITLTGTENIAGKTLREGDYTFRIDDNKVTIELKHKVVAEVEGRWEPRDTKWASDAFVAGTDGQVQEIRFAGQKRVFIIGSK